MQFLYFIPGWQRPVITPAELDAIGLGHMHGGVQPVATLTRLGDENGLLITAAESVAGKDQAGDCRLVPAEQTWRPGVRRDGKPLYHVGYWTAAKPTEASLRRQQFLAGRAVVLRDGAEWRVPVAEPEFGNATLPLVMDFDDDKQAWRGRPGPEFAELAKHARQAHDWLETSYFGSAEEKAKPIAFDGPMAAVAVTLGVCYRVGTVELAALGLLGSGEMWKVLEALTDWPALIEMLLAQKKTPAASA